MVVSERSVETVYGEFNVLSTANQRVPKVSALRKYVERGVATEDYERLPSLCRLAQAQRPGAGETDNPGSMSSMSVIDDSEGCIPVNTMMSEGSLVDQTTAERSEALWNRVDAFEGIQVKEKVGDPVPLDTFNLEFQGVLPKSESVTGMFGGRLNEDEWTLLDYHADYCRLGVEVGDIVVFENFTPEPSAMDECSRFSVEGLEGAREQRLEPLRYRIADITPHRLTLVRDTGDGLEQLARASFALPPAQAEAPVAPSAECVSQLLQYHVRAGDQQWLLRGAATGYRHRWVREGGVCVCVSVSFRSPWPSETR